MKHAASVRSEPGSNSPLSVSLCPSFSPPRTARTSFRSPIIIYKLTNLFAINYSLVKVQNKNFYKPFVFFLMLFIIKYLGYSFVKMTEILNSFSCTLFILSSTLGIFFSLAGSVSFTRPLYHTISILNVNTYFLFFLKNF